MRELPRFFAPPSPSFESRREFLTCAGNGFGMLALAGLLQEQGLLGKAAASTVDPRNPLAPHDGHFPAKAKAVIWLYMYGAPSGMDTFDPKPEIDKKVRDIFKSEKAAITAGAVSVDEEEEPEF